jgi:hypothetical protein
VSLDLDLVVAVDQIDQVRSLMEDSFRVEEFPHGVDVAAQGSDLRIQIRTDPRYGSFVDRASVRDVLGLRLPVASIEDMLQVRSGRLLTPSAAGPGVATISWISNGSWTLTPNFEPLYPTRYFLNSPDAIWPASKAIIVSVE